MAVHLVTGYAGHGHVTSADKGLYNAGICGLDRYVLRTGTQFEYTLQSANLLTIGSGDLVDQGRHISIPTNTTVDVTIDNGTQGKKRIDLIVMRYTKDSATSIESASIQIIKGTETAGTPVPPTCVTGDIFAGALADDVPLYQVALDGLTVTGVTPLFTVIEPLANISTLLAALKQEILDEAHPVGSIYMSFDDTSPATLFGGTWTRIQDTFLLAAGSNYAAGATGGEASHVLTSAEMPAHTHTGPNHQHSIGSHAHTVPAHTHSASCESGGAHTHNVYRWLAGAAGTARWLIQGTSDTVATQSGGAHSHTITIGNKPAFNTTSNGATNTTWAGTGNTGSAGSGTAHNNMPPYLAVYVWRRTA